jgi:hypothetical protein
MKEGDSGKVHNQELATKRKASHKEQGSYRKNRSTNIPLVSRVNQSEVLNLSTSDRPPRDLGAQLEMVGTLFGAEITLLPDGTLRVVDGHYLSRISPSGQLEQVDLDIKANEAVGDGQREA